MTKQEIIAALTPTAIMAELGVSQSSIKEARRKGFPANWYDAIDRMGRAKGLDISREHFNWRVPDQAEAS